SYIGGGGIQAAASAARRVVDTEIRVMNTNHAVVGYFTARSWRLPEHVCEAIAYHHIVLSIFGDESARDTQMKNLLAILKMD
ncbi:HDOD domain-containing protein, partial [Pseudomonas aeruginosa]